MKKGKWIIIVVILLIGGIGLWWWQSSASDPAQKELADSLTPELKVASVRIKNISDERIDLVSTVILKNPYPVEFSTNRIEYKAYIDSIKVIENTYDDPITIQSSDSTAIEVPMQILMDPMTRVLDYFKKNNIDSAHYALKANVVLDVPIEGREEFSMNISDTLPSIQPMEMQVKNIETNILSSDEGLDMIITAKNRNVYPTEIRNGSFSFTVKDEMKVVGNIEDVVYVPAKGSQDISVHTEKEWGSMTQSGMDFLFNQDDTRFILHFNGTLGSENNLLDDTGMNMKVEGTLGEISKALSQ